MFLIVWHSKTGKRKVTWFCTHDTYAEAKIDADKFSFGHAQYVVEIYELQLRTGGDNGEEAAS